MLEFMRIVQNEWIKLVRRRRFVVVLVLGVLMLVAFTWLTARDQQNQVRVQSIENQKMMIQGNISAMENQLNSPGFPADQKSGQEQQIQKEKDRLASLQISKAVVPTYDPAALQKQINDDKQQLKQLPPEQKWQAGSIQLDMLLTQYKYSHHVASIPPGQVLFVTSGWDGMRSFFEIGPSLFVPLLSVLLVADMVSGEQTGGTIKLLLIRPASRGKILLAKYVASVLANLLVGIVLFILLAAGMLLSLGTAHAEEPVAVGVRSIVQTVMQGNMIQTMTTLDVSHASAISMQAFILDSMGLTLLASIAMCTLGFFCSVLVRSAAVSTGLSMGIVIIGNIMQQVGRSSEWKKFFITSDFNLSSAWLGQGGVASATLTQALMILLCWTVGMYLIGHVMFRRRDILS